MLKTIPKPWGTALKRWLLSSAVVLTLFAFLYFVLDTWINPFFAVGLVTLLAALSLVVNALEDSYHSLIFPEPAFNQAHYQVPNTDRELKNLGDDLYRALHLQRGSLRPVLLYLDTLHQGILAESKESFDFSQQTREILELARQEAQSPVVTAGAQKISNLDRKSLVQVIKELDQALEQSSTY